MILLSEVETIIQHIREKYGDIGFEIDSGDCPLEPCAVHIMRVPDNKELVAVFSRTVHSYHITDEGYATLIETIKADA